MATIRTSRFTTCGIRSPAHQRWDRFATSLAREYAHDASDFLRDEFPEKFDGTVSNPAYGPRGKTAEAFIETGIRRLGNGFLALLLPADFDSAMTRRRFFDECAAFTAKIILTRRVKWFQNPTNPKVTPKENSAWFLWEGAVLRVRRPPIILYAPRPKPPFISKPQSPIDGFLWREVRDEFADGAVKPLQIAA